MAARILLRLATAAVLVFIYVPLVLVVIYAFNPSGTASWPPTGFTLKWFGEALENTGLRDAFLTSVLVALCATLIALALGTLLSISVARYRFFGRRDDLVHRAVPDRAAGHRDRHGAVHDVRDDGVPARVRRDRRRATRPSASCSCSTT